MNRAADARRRWWGAFCLLMAAGMLVWGESILKPHLKGLLFLVYWLGCFGFVLLAILIALFDLWVISVRRRIDGREVAKRSLEEAKHAKPSETAKPCDSTASRR
ncbi:MAG: hypothetical protein AB1705_23365 [Verrucomicrobiota bacterium]